MIFPHQRAVYEALRETSESFFSGRWKKLTIRPRFCRLVVGPSGSGKTHLIRTLARESETAFLALSATNWLPMGAAERGSQQTWVDIAKFANRYESGIIFIDEIDKLSFPTAWMTYLRVEVFSLLDSTVPANLKVYCEGDEYEGDVESVHRAKMEELSKRLADRFLVLGGGAFQDLWRISKESIGFGGRSSHKPGNLWHSQVSNIIPTELANRFASPILCLHPMELEDYRRMLRMVLTGMPPEIRRQIKRCATRSIERALADNLGCRWIEQLLLEVSIDAQRQVRRKCKKLFSSSIQNVRESPFPNKNSP